GPGLIGATIGGTTGLFKWTPTAQQAPSTNAVTIQVTDNGTPPLSASRSFTVVVANPPRLGGITPPVNRHLTLTLQAILGKTYRVEYKDNLGDANWVPLGADRLANAETLTLEDNLGTAPQRFYRLSIRD